MTAGHDWTDDERARTGRLHKAGLIARWAHARAMPPAQLAALSPRARRAAARLAHVRSCSEQTWALAGSLLAALSADTDRDGGP